MVVVKQSRERALTRALVLWYSREMGYRHHQCWGMLYGALLRSGIDARGLAKFYDCEPLEALERDGKMEAAWKTAQGIFR
jgi:hypothetical protein